MAQTRRAPPNPLLPALLKCCLALLLEAELSNLSSCRRLAAVWSSQGGLDFFDVGGVDPGAGRVVDFDVVPFAGDGVVGCQD